MLRKMFAACSVILFSLVFVNAQDQTPTASEKRVSLSETAVALDPTGSPALEGMLRSGSLNGAVDTPVTNTRLAIKNASQTFYSYVSGIATFYDASGIRCGEGLFKADALAPGETAETDTPGIRITCSPSSWRIVTSSVIPKSPLFTPGQPTPSTIGSNNLLISVDGEEHPIQLNRPLVLTVGDARRTIIVRQAQ